MLLIETVLSSRSDGTADSHRPPVTPVTWYQSCPATYALALHVHPPFPSADPRALSESQVERHDQGRDWGREGGKLWPIKRPRQIDCLYFPASLMQQKEDNGA